jgi:hypothetical protein
LISARRCKQSFQGELQPGQVGEFVKEWARLEEYLLENARRVTERNVSVREAIASLGKRGRLDQEQALMLDSLRRFRNEVIHQPKTVQPGALEEWLGTTRNSGGIFERMRSNIGLQPPRRPEPV